MNILPTVYVPLKYPNKAQAEAWVNQVPSTESKWVSIFTHTTDHYLFYNDDIKDYCKETVVRISLPWKRKFQNQWARSRGMVGQAKFYIAFSKWHFRFGLVTE